MPYIHCKLELGDAFVHACTYYMQLFSNCFSTHTHTQVHRLLTYPNWSRWLLVILHFWNVINCFSHTVPVEGLSGCTYNRPLSLPIGSAFPVITHSESWNLYLLSPTGTISITMAYLWLGLSPDTLTFTTGNILLITRESQQLELINTQSANYTLHL